MEQYWMSGRLDWKHLRMCLDFYRPESIDIRKVGSLGGERFVDVKLGRKRLDFDKGPNGLTILIASKPVFRFPLRDHSQNKGFSLAYERFWSDGCMYFDSHGRDPYAAVPAVKRSFLRHVLDDCLLEIYFPGKIPLKFHRWAYPDERTWKLYRIDERRPQCRC